MTHKLSVNNGGRILLMRVHAKRIIVIIIIMQHLDDNNPHQHLP